MLRLALSPLAGRIFASMGDPARKTPVVEDDLALTDAAPLTAEERGALVEALAEAEVSDAFRESFRRDLG